MTVPTPGTGAQRRNPAIGAGPRYAAASKRRAPGREASGQC